MNDNKLVNLEELKKAIEMGLDIEFYLRGIRYNISWSEHKPFIAICPDGDASVFENADALLSNYRADGLPIKELWSEMDIIAM